MFTDINYRGSGVIVSETSSYLNEVTTTQVRPQGINSGWMYLHKGKTVWMTYHIHRVEQIKIEQNMGVLTDNPTTTLTIDTGFGEHLTIFLNGASIDMIAEAIEAARNIPVGKP